MKLHQSVLVPPEAVCRLIFLVILCSLSACTNMLFYPDKEFIQTPSNLGISYEDINFKSSDGTSLHGWFLPAKGNVSGSVLFVHGNAENISTHIASVYWLPEQGYNVFLFDYRGYGLSKGSPSLEGIVMDFEAALELLLRREEVNTGKIIVFGQSLGGAIAVYSTATSRNNHVVQALIVESAFASYRDIARDKFASFILTWPLQWPLAYLFPDDFSPVNVVKDLSPIPLLVIHGDADQIVPLKHGKALYNAAEKPKEFWIIPHGSHMSAFRSTANRKKLLEYLEKLEPL